MNTTGPYYTHQVPYDPATAGLMETQFSSGGQYSLHVPPSAEPVPGTSRHAQELRTGKHFTHDHDRDMPGMMSGDLTQNREVGSETAQFGWDFNDKTEGALKPADDDKYAGAELGY